MFCMCHLRMELPKSEKPKNCIFCNRCEDDELQYGKFYKLDGDIVTHYFCLLLSSNMEQNGRDNEGILGFLREDILKELKRGKRLTCSYCKLTGASLGCCVARCKKKFHLPCGLKAGSLHQYFGQFKSFCASHRPTQMIDPNILKQGRKDGVTCFICYEELDTSDSRTILWAPCCRVNAWFHRKCVQRMAMTAGYFFKCPMCNNKEMFYETMQQFGIYIPEQDAAWELEPNAYQDLLYRHHRCDTAQCLDPKGREHEVAGTRWEIVLCLLCGSKGTHLGCANLTYSNVDWECDDCSRVGSSETSNESDSLTNNPEASVARRPRRSWRGPRRRITRKQKIVRQPSNDEDEDDDEDDDDDEEEEEEEEEEDRVSTPSAEATSSNRQAGPASPGTTTATYCSPPPRSESSDQSSSSDSDSGETSTVPHLASQTVLDVITLDSDDDDDDEVIVITDDDAEENDKSSNIVVYTCDGRKIPVASIPASSNNLCVEGDLAVRMPGDTNTQAGQTVDPLLEEAMIDTVQCDSRNLVNIARTGMNNNNNTMVLVNPKPELRQNPNIQVNSSRMQSNQNKSEPQTNSSLSQTNTVLLPWPQTAATNATRIPAPQTTNVPSIQPTSVNTVNPERICKTNQSLQPSRIQVQQPRKYQEMQPPRRQGQQPLQLAQGQQQQSQVQQSTILREQQSATQFGSYSSVREPSRSNKRLRTTEQMPDTSHSVSSQTTGSVLKTYLSEPRGSRQQATNQPPVMMSQQLASPSMAMYGDSYGQPVMLMMPQEQLPTQTSYIGEQTVNQPSLLLVPQEPDQQNAMSVDPAANSSLLNGDGEYNADIPAICPDNDSYAATAIGTATTAIGAATTNSVSANDATATRTVTATTNAVSENNTSATRTVTAREPTTSAEQQNDERHRRGNRTGGQHSHTGLIPSNIPIGDFSFRVNANTFMFIPDNYNYPCVRAVSKGHSRALVRPRSPSIPRTNNNSEGRSRARTRPVRVINTNRKTDRQRSSSREVNRNRSQSSIANRTRSRSCSTSSTKMHSNNRSTPTRETNRNRSQSRNENIKTRSRSTPTRETNRNRSQSRITNKHENRNTRSRSCSTSSRKMHRKNRSTPPRETNRSRSQSRITKRIKNKKVRSRSHSASPSRKMHKKRRNTPARETNRSKSHSTSTSRTMHRRSRSASTRNTNRSRSTTPYGERKVISPLYSNVEVFQNQMITRRKKEESCMQLRRLGGRKRTYASIMTSLDLTLDYVKKGVFPGRRRLSCRMTEKLDPNTMELNTTPVPQETDSVLASNIDTDRKETPNTVSQQDDISSKRPSRPSSRNSVLSERPQPSSLNSVLSERPRSLSRNNFPSRSVITRSWSKTVLRKRKRKDLSPSFEYPKLTSQPRRRSNSASTASRRSKMNNRILSRKSRTRTRSEGDPVSEDEREVITEVTSNGYTRAAIEDSVQKSSYSENIFKIKRLALSARKSMPESERTLHEQRKNLEKLQKLNSMSFGEGLPDLL